MLTWMLYVVVITLLLSAAALAAERAARLRRAPTRWIWAVTIVASLLIPVTIVSLSVQVPSLLTPTISRKAIPLRDLTTVPVVPLAWVREHTFMALPTLRENRLLQRAWNVVSAVLLTALLLNGLQLMWRKRRWRITVVAGVPVYIAPDVGPAVVGLLRPRIVVPEWIERASPSRQAMVLAHEQSHLLAHDPLLLTVGLFLLVLMPWNLPLWWQLHRLRRAIEVDCDARVIKGGLDTRQYGETLIDVSQHPSGYIGSVAAMSEARSFLEERISIMVRGHARWGSVIAAALGCLAVCLVALAAQVTPPNFRSFESNEGPVAPGPNDLDQYVGFYLRGSNVVYALTRDGDHLLVHPPNSGVFEMVADSEMRWVLKNALGPSFSFARDASGGITGLVEHYANLFSVPLRRIDRETAQTIKDNNHTRALGQTPMPGGEAALRRLIEGILVDKSNYDEMTPWYADLVRQAGYLTRAAYSKKGAVRSIEFRHVNENGGDVYEVRHDRGFSSWTLWLDSSGIIQDSIDNEGAQ